MVLIKQKRLFDRAFKKMNSFECSVEYNEKTMNKGLKLVSNLKVDFGGTELMVPLEDIFNK